jgi:hypothetical protein
VARRPRSLLRASPSFTQFRRTHSLRVKSKTVHAVATACALCEERPKEPPRSVVHLVRKRAAKHSSHCGGQYRNDSNVPLPSLNVVAEVPDPVMTRDAAGNVTRAELDYRVLARHRVTDANGNRTEARFDALGLLVGTVVAGKAQGPAEGDSFEHFVADLSPAEIARYFAVRDPRCRERVRAST